MHQAAKAAKAARASKAQDARLRRAVSLYHLGPSFYPTPAKADEGSPDASQRLDEHIDKTIRLDLFGRPNERAYSAGATFALPDPPRHFTGDVLMSRLNDVVSRGPSDGSDWQAPTDDFFLPASEQVSQDLAATNTVVDQKGLAAVRRQFLSSANDSSSNFKPLESRPILEDDAPSQHHIQTSSSAAVRQGAVDEGTARIRDALFGTVGAGEKPGLDVIRKRREARQETIRVQELLEQQQKRQQEPMPQKQQQKRQSQQQQQQTTQEQALAEQAAEQSIAEEVEEDALAEEEAEEQALAEEAAEQVFAERAKIQQALEEEAMQGQGDIPLSEMEKHLLRAHQVAQEDEFTERQSEEESSKDEEEQTTPKKQPEPPKGTDVPT